MLRRLRRSSALISTVTGYGLLRLREYFSIDCHRSDQFSTGVAATKDDETNLQRLQNDSEQSRSLDLQLSRVRRVL